MIAFSNRDCPLVWMLVEYAFNHSLCLCKDVRCGKSKQTVNASQDGIRFHRTEITYFEINIICLRQADYIRRNSFLIKVQVLNILFTINCVT